MGDPVTATDTNAADVLTYSLSGADAESFSIGMASGQLRTKVLLDHDTKASYDGRCNGGGPVGPVRHHHGDHYGHRPKRAAGDYREDFGVLRGRPHGYVVATYTAADPENGTDNLVAWRATTAGTSSISAAQAYLTFKHVNRTLKTRRDEDTDNVYLITVQASDGTNTVPWDVDGYGDRLRPTRLPLLTHLRWRQPQPTGTLH